MPKLGQHFLKNESAITRIVDALALKKGETVIEIGPGTGALTKPLAEVCEKVGCKLIAIEKDAELIGELMTGQVGDGKEFGHQSQVSSADRLKNIEIVSGDALIELPRVIAKIGKIPYKIVGNIPYYITGHLLRVIGELERKPIKTVLMIQKEVAERVCAEPPEMNLLAAATQIWSEAKLLFTLPPKDFDPPPQVWSAVIMLHTKNLQLEREKLAGYYRAIKIIFKQPRKTLINNLSEALSREQAKILMEKLNLAPEIRPQNLTIENIIRLSEPL